MDDLDCLLNRISMHTIKNFNIRITIDMINKPRILNTWIIYLSFLKTMDILVENAYMIQAAQRLQTQYIIHYEDSVPQLNTYFLIKKIMHNSGFSDFQFDDFIRPTKDRFIMVLRKILEILEKKELFYTKFLNILDESENEELEAERLKDLLISYQSVYEEKKNQKIQNEQSIKKVTEALDNLKNKNMLLTIEKDEQKKEIAVVKHELIESQDILNDFLKKVSEINDQVNEKKSKILQSPEDLKAQYHKSEQTLNSLQLEYDNERKILSQLEENIKKSQSNLKMYQRFEVPFQSLLVHCNRKEELTNQIQTVLSQKEGILHDIKALSNDYEFTFNENTRFNGTLKNLKAFHNSSIAEKKKMLSDIKNNEYILKNSIENFKKLIDDGQFAVQSIKEECEKLNQKYNQQKEEILKENMNVFNEIVTYIERFSIIEDKMINCAIQNDCNLTKKK